MRNEAHDLIDRGLAVLWEGVLNLPQRKLDAIPKEPEMPKAPFDYSNRQMQPNLKGGRPGFKTKETTLEETGQEDDS